MLGCTRALRPWYSLMAVSDKERVCRGGSCSSCWRWMCPARPALSSASIWRATSAPTTAAPSSVRCVILSST